MNAMTSHRIHLTLAARGLALACTLAVACGGPDEGDAALEQTEGAVVDGAAACMRSYANEMQWLLNFRPLDLETETAAIMMNLTARNAQFDCEGGENRSQSCYDSVLDLHYESHFCTVKRPDRGLRYTTPVDTFRFSAAPVAGANPSPLYRCVRDGRDMVTRSPTCGTLNVAPLTELGYSFPAGTPGATEVFRCRRVGRADIFLSRDPSCGGHVREATFGFAK